MKEHKSHLNAEITPQVADNLKEYSIIKLNTHDYENKGLRKGEIGTIVDVHDHPRRGYTVEFHDVPPDNLNKVTTFEPHEIDLVQDAPNE